MNTFNTRILELEKEVDDLRKMVMLALKSNYGFDNFELLDWGEREEIDLKFPRHILKTYPGERRVNI